VPDVQAIPDGYPQLSPFLCIDGADEAIAFYSSVLGAIQRVRMLGADGKVGHAELQIGESVVMISDEFPDMGMLSPKSIGGSPVTLGLYVADVDAVFERALQDGAKALRPVTDQFYGDRSGLIEDPFGHRWSIATHVEDVSSEELNRRAAIVTGDLP
jgi:PhnB protein